MKKWICILLSVIMLMGLCACGQKQETAAKPEAAAEPAATTAQENNEWSRQGYFSDENENMLSITLMEDVVDPGWYVGAMIGEFMGGATLPQEGNTLHGNLNASEESAEPYIVTISEEGEDGLLVAVEGGESYHFVPMDLPDATIFVTIGTEGLGNIAYEEGEEAPEIDLEYPFQSAQINLGEPTIHTLVAWPQAGNLFVKWTKNGEDFSTDPQITVMLDESADFVAVFEEDPDWRNPVTDFAGEYQCERAHAQVDCFGAEEAWIIIEWGGSASELAHWDIVGKPDPDTQTITYSDSVKQIIVYKEDGEIESQEIVSEDNSGTIVFNGDGTFTWHDDQSEYGVDMVFELLPAEEAADSEAEAANS